LCRGDKVQKQSEHPILWAQLASGALCLAINGHLIETANSSTVVGLIKNVECRRDRRCRRQAKRAESLAGHLSMSAKDFLTTIKINFCGGHLKSGVFCDFHKHGFLRSKILSLAGRAQKSASS